MEMRGLENVLNFATFKFVGVMQNYNRGRDFFLFLVEQSVKGRAVNSQYF